MKLYGFEIEELLEGFGKTYETEDNLYTRKILDDIDLWLKEEYEREEYLQEKFKETKHFDFEPIDFDE